MKRCPECQFLYDNETIKCDMDGTPLRYTVALPSLPGLAKSIWDKWTIALLCAVLLGTVLVILYRATPQALSEAPAGQMKLPKQGLPAANPAKQLPDTTASPSESSAVQQEADAADGFPGSRDPFESPKSKTETRTQRSNGPSLPAESKDPTPAAVIHFEAVSNSPTASTSNTAAAPAMTKTAAAEKSASQTPAASTSATAFHPKPPESYAGKPASPSDKKDSGVKSFFKKAGKVLKKPFGEN